MDENKPPLHTHSKVKDVDRELVWRLATIMCTAEEIADVVGLPAKTVRIKFGDLIEKGRSVGRKALRRAQFEKAINDKDPRLLIFLGKNYLAQKENPEDKEKETPLPWED